MANFEPIKTKKRFRLRAGSGQPPRPYCRDKNKHSYKTRGEGEKVRLKLLKVEVTEYLRVYKCRLCHWFHLTSQPPRKYARKNIKKKR